ncbi:stripes inner membrane complex protein, putative [Plasmodium vinckei lentum]|uniref:Stripes inner membrane complex protein, putative n=1 Tax=Plasmodium vinckei lentum TaxID=138297 RepID=A0A6V7S8V5_PLAVN|nr:stripes inner membrane complex protein, putative [Plasmodium vinckei lentum]
MPKISSESHEIISNKSDIQLKTEDESSSNRKGSLVSNKMVSKDVYNNRSSVQQLLSRIAQEIDENKPNDVIHFIVDFLCKHYPEHLHGFEAVWNGDPDLEKERILVVEFFKSQKLPADISVHFINAGFDTIETLCTLSTNSLDDVEKFNNTRWLPGHKVRLQQTFNDITNRVKNFKEERDSLIKSINQRFISPPHLLNSIMIPKRINPIILPSIPHISSPIQIPNRTCNYTNIDKRFHAPIIFKR